MSEPRIKVLVVEDEPAFASALQDVLRHAMGAAIDLALVGTLRETLDRLKETHFDVLLLDLSLPDQLGLRTYADAHTAAPAVPIIVLTGLDDETLALQAMRDGAQDYLVKGQFDGRTLARVIRYAIERKRAAAALRESEEFFRLISENVTDLIAVIDHDGNRLYNSPSYRKLLGNPETLLGTNSFDDIHPEDRERVKELFRDTIATGVGRRAEYRFQLKDGQVRHVESVGSVIREPNGLPGKVVVVSRDITAQREAVKGLSHALAELKQSHEDLKATQLQLIQAERLQAVSTFAAGVAHEVKNPLQTILLGVDYLAHTPAAGDPMAGMVLNDMSSAVGRADAIIRGLLEFSASNKREICDANLNHVLEHALQAVENDRVMYPITLTRCFVEDLPPLRLDLKAMKHVFINLLMNSVRALADGGALRVATFTKTLTAEDMENGRIPGRLKPGEEIVFVEIEETLTQRATANDGTGFFTQHTNTPREKGIGVGLTVLKKIIELSGGVIDIRRGESEGRTITILFRVKPVNQS